MKMGIMQPYFLPYIGYWQLLNAVDLYIVLDDVNFINRGWINRNRILINGQISYLNIPIRGASQNKRINEIPMDWDDRKRKQIKRKIQLAYSRAPYFDQVYLLFCGIVDHEEESLSGFLENSLKAVCGYMGIETQILRSSELEKDDSLKGQERILNLCQQFHADEYYNAIGGQSLYSYDRFRRGGVKLSFLKTGQIQYEQFFHQSVPNLSILDVMMFHSPEQLQGLLKNYTLLTDQTGGEIGGGV